MNRNDSLAAMGSLLIPGSPQKREGRQSGVSRSQQIMESVPPPRPGIVSSLQSLGDSLLAAVQQRLQLISVELQEEKFRLIQIVIWISAAAFATVLATAFASITLVYLFWDTARLAVLGGLTLFYTAALAAIVIAFRRYLARQPEPFAATLQELKEDRACIRKKT